MRGGGHPRASGVSVEPDAQEAVFTHAGVRCACPDPDIIFIYAHTHSHTHTHTLTHILSLTHSDGNRSSDTGYLPEHVAMQNVAAVPTRLEVSPNGLEVSPNGLEVSLDSKDPRQRLATFASWPFHSHTSYPPVSLLAAAGFVYAPSDEAPDSVVCVSCKVRLASWEGVTDPQVRESVCVCVCVCVFVCVLASWQRVTDLQGGGDKKTCVCACVSICAHTHTRTRTRARTHTHTHIHI